MKVIKIVCLIFGSLVLCVLSLAAIMLLGWVMALSILRGWTKAGPRESWNDVQARAEVKVRRVELKIAAAILALYIIAIYVAIVFVTTGAAGQPRSLAENIMNGVAIGLIPLAMAPGMYLTNLAPIEWRNMNNRLRQRVMNPVLF